VVIASVSAGLAGSLDGSLVVVAGATVVVVVGGAVVVVAWSVVVGAGAVVSVTSAPDPQAATTTDKAAIRASKDLIVFFHRVYSAEYGDVAHRQSVGARPYFVSQRCDTLRALRTSKKGCVVDLNLVVLAGRLAAEPEMRTFESGAILVQLLLSVRSSSPRQRIDVVPVVQWNPDVDDIPEGPLRGVSVWVAGSAQRRFWSVGDGRSSRIEVVAHEIAYRPDGLRIAGEAPGAS
jgi:hypothetical protein